MGAGSRFDQPLTLINDGHKVVACGPLGFFGCEVNAEVTITLRQPGKGIASGHCHFPNTNVDPDKCEEEVGDDEDEWMLTCPVRPEATHSRIASVAWSAAAFTLTPAYGGTGALVIAHGVITYLNQSTGGMDTQIWDASDLECRWQ